MALRDLFVARARRKVVKGEAMAAAAPSGSVGVFVTPQSLASFPVASSVVVMICGLLKSLGPWGASKWVAVLASLAVGAVIFICNVTHPDAAPRSKTDWLVASVVALINSLFLAAAALGILK